MKSIIGKVYVPQDNSYCVTLPNEIDAKLIGVSCMIIKDPYEKIVNTLFGDEKMVFVNVMSLETHLTYRVLFQESWIYNKIKPQEVNDRVIVVKL